MADEPTDHQGTLFEDGKKPPADPTTELAAIKAEMARTGQVTTDMQQRLAAMQQQLQAGRPTPQADPNAGDKLNQEMWDTLQRDPKQLLSWNQRQIAQAMQAYDAQQRQARFPSDKAAARNSVREQDGYSEVFQKFGTDIESYIKENWGDNPQAFTSPEAWRIAADAVRGKKWKELMPRENETDPGAPGKPSHKPLASGKNDGDEKLSEAETYAAEHVFGIGKKDYAKHKKIAATDDDRRNQSTWQGRGILKSALANMYYKDMNRTVSGFPNPHYGKMRPYMTFDSQVQKPRHPRDGE